VSAGSSECTGCEGAWPSAVPVCLRSLRDPSLPEAVQAAAARTTAREAATASVPAMWTGAAMSRGEVPDSFAVARWSRDADVSPIARCILGTLKYEPHRRRHGAAAGPGRRDQARGGQREASDMTPPAARAREPWWIHDGDAAARGGDSKEGASDNE
jgi:hypothetical protein